MSEQHDGLRQLYMMVWEYMQQGSQVIVLELQFGIFWIFEIGAGTSKRSPEFPGGSQRTQRHLQSHGNGAKHAGIFGEEFGQ